jgi:carbonic anhydrase/acetyltransferase-like protein (isoleucine patch superfamily)
VIEDYVLLDTRLNPNSYILIGKRSKIKQGGILRTYNGFIKIGDRTTIGEYTVIAGHGGITNSDRRLCTFGYEAKP